MPPPAHQMRNLARRTAMRSARVGARLRARAMPGKARRHVLKKGAGSRVFQA